MTGAARPSNQASERRGVLFVLPWEPAAAGGVNSVVSALIAGFGKRRIYRPLLLVNTYPCRGFDLGAAAGAPSYFQYFLPPPFDLSRAGRSVLAYLARLPVVLPRFIAFLRREGVVAVDVHYPGLSAFTILLARFLAFRAFRVVLSFHGADVPRSARLAERLLWRFILRRADAVVACSQSLADELRNFDSAVAVRVVHNAVDAAYCRSKARRSALPSELRGRRYLLSVGKFEHKKAHDVLIASFEQLAASDPVLSLAIIGASGPAFVSCSARVAASRFGDRILLYRDLAHGSTLSAIESATLLVLPSRREPFGIVILEAAVLGTPVVASRVGGIPEIVENGHTGMLVAPDDIEALSSALRQALASPDASAARATLLRKRVRQTFPLAAQVRAYEQVLRASPRRSRAGEASRQM